MVFKFIDAGGKTHLMECTSLSYLGSGRMGYDLAVGLDGGENIVNYDEVGTESSERRFFVVYPPSLSRSIVAVHARGAWLMNDRGDTIENLRVLDEPRGVSAQVVVS